MFNSLSEKIKQLLENEGIDPLYFVTLIAIVFVLPGFKNDIKKFSTLPRLRKHFVASTVGSVVILFIVSILKIFGLISF